MDAGRDDTTRYRAAFEHAFDAMVVGDDDGRCVDANPAACELYGVDREELLGSELAAFVGGDHGGDTVLETLRDERQYRGRFQLERPDGDVRDVEFAATHEIQPGEHLAVVRDVTEQVERERQLLEEIERLDQFASMVSHDLQSPVDAALGHLDLYHEEGDLQHYEASRRALERVADLTTELLTLVQHDEEAGDRGELSLEAVARDVWADTDTRDATLAVVEDVAVLANRRRLSLLLSNLFRNAVGHGGYDVAVRVGPLDGAFDDPGFYVEDTGRGIPEATREQVLEYGYSTGYGGSGVGLTIVQRIASSNGWALTVTESAEGGARFEFRTG